MARGIRSRGSRGIPPEWVARSTSVTSSPARVAGTPGTYSATRSSRATSPRPTISASRVAVKVLVTDPISNRVSGSSERSVPDVPQAPSVRRSGSIRTATAPRTRPATRRATGASRGSAARSSAPARRPTTSACTRPMITGTAEAARSTPLPYTIAAGGSAPRASTIVCTSPTSTPDQNSGAQARRTVMGAESMPGCAGGSGRPRTSAARGSRRRPRRAASTFATPRRCRTGGPA